MFYKSLFALLLAVAFTGLSMGNEFIFEGTVKSKLEDDDDSFDLYEVKVTKVVSSPAAIDIGVDDTIRLWGNKNLAIDSSLRFSCKLLSVGDTLTVQAISSGSMTNSELTPQESKAQRLARLKQIVQSSERVLSGRVVSIQQAEDGQIVPEDGDVKKPIKISEHSAVWQEAVVEVDESLKGSFDAVDGKAKVVVRFPVSNDVKWFLAPKFQVGDNKLFALNKDNISGLESAGEKYIAVSADKVLDIKGLKNDDLSTIKSLVEEEAKKKSQIIEQGNK